MADTLPSLFISYSRTDSEFVDRLQADLQSRGYNTWVDRKRLEGGQDWAETIQRAIERCQVMLIALSPEAVASEWVRREIGFAQETGKRMLPLMVRPVAQVPIRIQGIQWVDFEIPYERALDALLFSLATPVATPPPEPQAAPSGPLLAASAATDATESGESGEDLVVARQGPPPPDPNLNALYASGVEARSEGNLELASVYWQQILDRSPEFGNGLVASQLEALMQQLRPQRQQRLREQAQNAMAEGDYRRATGAWQAMLAVSPDDEDIKRGMRAALKARALQAARQGVWGEEIGAWEALRAFDAESPEPTERIAIAEQNQQWAWLYVNAQNFARENKLAPARDALDTLWGKAPYFGDPAGIAAIVGATVPPSFDDVRAEQERQRKAQEELDRKREAEEAERTRQREAEEAERTRQLMADADRAARRQRRPKFVSDSLDTNVAVVWIWTLLPLIGAGFTSGILAEMFSTVFAPTSQDGAFVMACAGILLTAALMYAIGYRRAVSFPALIGLAVLAAAASYVVVWEAPQAYHQIAGLTIYSVAVQPIQGHLLWLSGANSTVGARLVWATIYGAVLGVAAGVLTWAYARTSSAYDAFVLAVSGIVGPVVALALGIALSVAVGGGWSFLLGIVVALVWTIGIGGALVLGAIWLYDEMNIPLHVLVIGIVVVFAGLSAAIITFWGRSLFGTPPEALWVLIPALFMGAGVGSAVALAKWEPY